MNYYKNFYKTNCYIEIKLFHYVTLGFPLISICKKILFLEFNVN